MLAGKARRPGARCCGAAFAPGDGRMLIGNSRSAPRRAEFTRPASSSPVTAAKIRQERNSPSVFVGMAVALPSPISRHSTAGRQCNCRPNGVKHRNSPCRIPTVPPSCLRVSPRRENPAISVPLGPAGIDRLWHTFVGRRISWHSLERAGNMASSAVGLFAASEENSPLAKVVHCRHCPNKSLSRAQNETNKGGRGNLTQRRKGAKKTKECG
jgi:hypothetical protein